MSNFQDQFTVKKLNRRHRKNCYNELYPGEFELSDRATLHAEPIDFTEVNTAEQSFIYQKRHKTRRLPSHPGKSHYQAKSSHSFEPAPFNPSFCASCRRHSKTNSLPPRSNSICLECDSAACKYDVSRQLRRRRLQPTPTKYSRVPPRTTEPNFDARLQYNLSSQQSPFLSQTHPDYDENQMTHKTNDCNQWNQAHSKFSAQPAKSLSHCTTLSSHNGGFRHNNSVVNQLQNANFDTSQNPFLVEAQTFLSKQNKQTYTPKHNHFPNQRLLYQHPSKKHQFQEEDAELLPNPCAEKFDNNLYPHEFHCSLPFAETDMRNEISDEHSSDGDELSFEENLPSVSPCSFDHQGRPNMGPARIHYQRPYNYEEPGLHFEVPSHYYFDSTDDLMKMDDSQQVLHSDAEWYDELNQPKNETKPRRVRNIRSPLSSPELEEHTSLSETEPKHKEDSRRKAPYHKRNNVGLHLNFS